MIVSTHNHHSHIVSTEKCAITTNNIASTNRMVLEWSTDLINYSLLSCYTYPKLDIQAGKFCVEGLIFLLVGTRESHF